MTIKISLDKKREVIPQQRRALEEIFASVDQKHLMDLLFASNDLNIQLSALKTFSSIYPHDEVSTNEDILEHILETLLAQLYDAIAHNEDGEEAIKSMLQSFLLRRSGTDGTPVPNPTKRPTWPWPVVNAPESKVSDPGYAEDWNEMSPLKIFGYTVGKTRGWVTSKRKGFLDDFMTYELPDVVIQTYGDYYGEPNSVDRLKATAQLFASLIKSAKRRRDNSMRFAIDDWSNDLEYLRIKYYEEKGLKFYSWPSTNLR